MDHLTPLQARIVDLESEVKRLEMENAELRHEVKQADSANKAKSDFLAMISHEIRTPMNGVIGLSELLLDTELQPRQKHFAQLIRTSATSLLTLINNLLDFSKIEANKMALDIESFDLCGLLDQMIALYQVTGRRKGLTVNAEIDPTLHAQYQGDAYRLRQVLINLLGNAVKFTEHGSITLRVIRQRQETDVDLLRFEVEDSGVGIADDALGKLFLPFSQVDGSSTRRYGGTGLGLSICAKLVRLMDGELGVRSEFGKGTTFWFIVPLAPVGHETSSSVCQLHYLPEVQPAPVAPASVSSEISDNGAPLLLVVDDEETNRVVITETFRTSQVQIVTASNGQEAIEACRGTRFNLIFMDCQMPVVDGFEATRAILEESGDQLAPPAIIALTADATAATRKRCQEVGMVDYLIKPIDFTRLQEVLSTWLPELPPLVIPGTGGKTAKELFVEGHPGSVVVNQTVLERLREHVGDIGPVVNIFLQSLDRRLAELQQAIDRRDADAIKSIAHTMKGSSSQFGAETLAHSCLLLENLGKSNNLQQADRMYAQLVEAAAAVKQFFAA